MGKHNRRVVGLDIGSTKVSAVVGEVTAEGDLEIIGVGNRPSKGLRKGVIVDIDSTVEVVLKVVEDAEMMAGTRIDAVYVGIGGGQVDCLTTEASMELVAKEVTQREIEQVIEMARLQTPSEQHEALHVMPIEYRLDEEAGISNPLGRRGTKLGVWAQVITASVPAIEALMKVVDQAKLEVQGIVAQQLASARAVLTSDERDMGVALLDIGGGTTDITVYGAGTVRHASSLAVGGNHITHDLAVGLRTPVTEAERIKRQYGRALRSFIEAHDMIDVQSLGAKEPQPTPRTLLGEIIECRVEEVFALALHRIQQQGLYGGLSSGVVITGGACVMPGMTQAAEAVFEMPVRLGFPMQISGLTDLVNTPMHATGVGLALFARDQLLEHEADHVRRHVGSGVFRRVTAWIENFFE
ncbi:MAG TPA: cell division protein FtsA [Candidatus Tectomicrobia bacterium]|nr:cell division protein FtsA [Candidatus Tectomicrobia bacterium]